MLCMQSTYNCSESTVHCTPIKGPSALAATDKSCAYTMQASTFNVLDHHGMGKCALCSVECANLEQQWSTVVSRVFHENTFS